MRFHLNEWSNHVYFIRIDSFLYFNNMKDLNKCVIALLLNNKKRNPNLSIVVYVRNFSYQPRAKSRDLFAAFLSASLFEYGVYQIDTNVIPITPFWWAYKIKSHKFEYIYVIVIKANIKVCAPNYMLVIETESRINCWELK